MGYKTCGGFIDTFGLSGLTDDQLQNMTCPDAESSPWIQWQWLGALARHTTGSYYISHGINPWGFGVTDNERQNCISKIETRAMVVAQGLYAEQCEHMEQSAWLRVARHWIAQQIWFLPECAGRVECNQPYTKPLHQRYPTFSDMCSARCKTREFRADGLSQLAMLAFDHWNQSDNSNPFVIWSDAPETLLAIIDAARQWHERHKQWAPEGRVYVLFREDNSLLDMGQAYRHFYDNSPIVGKVYEAMAALYLSMDDDALYLLLMAMPQFLELVKLNPINCIEMFIPIWIDMWKRRIALDKRNHGTLASIVTSKELHAIGGIDMFYFCAHLKQAGLDPEHFRLAPYHGLSRWFTYTFPIRNPFVKDIPSNMLLTETFAIERDPNVFLQEPERQRWFCAFASNGSPPIWYLL